MGSLRATPIPDQDNDQCITSLTEDKLRLIPVAIEHKPLPSCPEVMLFPEHRQTDQLVEAIVGINDGCAACLCILSQ